MQIIYLGNASHRTSWLEAVRAHGGATIVESDTDAQLAIVSGARLEAAIEAMERGLSVILEAPEEVSADTLNALSATSEQSGRVVLARASADVYAPRETLIKEYLTPGKLGAIGHVSCVDHRRRDDLNGRTDRHAQLFLAACGHWLSLQRLFGREPISIMARLSGGEDCELSTAAFLDFGSDVHVQYFGSIRTQPDLHNAWIEGAGGSLQTDGRNLTWRKRGWRFFVPLRVSFGRHRMDVLQTRRRLLSDFEAIVRDPGCDQAATARTTLAMLRAAVESDERGRAVELA